MKSGTVAVIGRANAGKSTLVNVLVGEKVAIVSPKPQTTRNRILGIYNGDGCQIVFEDTPGIYKAKTVLSGNMMQETERTAKDVDVIMFVHDGHRGISDEDVAIIKNYYSTKKPFFIAYTKTDIMPADKIPLDFKTLYENGIDCEVFPVSARRGKNIAKLKEYLISLLPEGEALFPEDVISDKSERFMIAELMREKILLKYDKEIPHGVAIIINQFERGKKVCEINLDIVVEKQNHKAIIIGKQGAALKETLSFARQDMEKFLGCKVFLTAFVKVKEDWRNNGYLLGQYFDGN